MKLRSIRAGSAAAIVMDTCAGCSATSRAARAGLLAQGQDTPRPEHRHGRHLVQMVGLQRPPVASRSSYRRCYAGLPNARVDQLPSASMVADSTAGVTVNGLRVDGSPVIVAGQRVVQVAP